MKYLRDFDPEVHAAIVKEEERQRWTLGLVASENFASRAVLETAAAVLTNKYAEGYPGKRYYGGCENVDLVENLARERACNLFQADHANVQPHSGSQANMAVYFATLSPGDTALGMSLAHGGHLTHGSPVNFSGKFYNFVSYGVDPDTELIDYEEVRKIARQKRPRVIVAGASAYPRIIDFERFRQIADEVEAILVVDMAHIAGLVAAGVHPSPIPYAEFVTSTTHKTLRGPRGGFVLCKRQYASILDRMVFPGIQGGPLEHIIAAKAVAFKEASTEEFRRYQEQVVKNARALASEMLELGFRLVSGGTDNHLLLVDLRNFNITGKEAETLLESVGITVNKNSIPFDDKSPQIASGIRLGVPAVTTRGMREAEMKEIARLIFSAITNRNDSLILEKVRKRVRELCEAFPIYA